MQDGSASCADVADDHRGWRNALSMFRYQRYVDAELLKILQNKATDKKLFTSALHFITDIQTVGGLHLLCTHLSYTRASFSCQRVSEQEEALRTEETSSNQKQVRAQVSAAHQTDYNSLCWVKGLN
ncbi:hypothetical protein CHARACLAT_030119 [Characodon lateralis]|uniref:Uncharacterized protein n=1 Tax=Characodon lateralis TaxID=208331 RepID=A0ABU7DLI0_9TELE|nr:hypothetical protein [Characodon lateralis]